MVAVKLEKSDLALFSDLTRRVTIPALLSVTPTRTYEGATVRFLGDTYGTPFRGEGRARTYALSCRFASYQQQALADLLALIDDAATLPDSRLFLRTHFGQTGGIDDAMAVTVLSVTPTPQAGLYVDVTLTCEAVEHSLAV